MQLRNQVEWALHCCVLMAGLRPGHYLPTKDLAEFHGVPKEYLSKALQALSAAGLVESALGPSGGYRLAKRPQEISFMNIVDAVEGDSSSFVCTNIRFRNPCLPSKAQNSGARSKPCSIAAVMWDAEEAWRAKLAAVTISDIAGGLEETLPAALQTSMRTWIDERS